jgi:DNA-binding ferritin-like protein (Dps family)
MGLRGMAWPHCLHLFDLPEHLKSDIPSLKSYLYGFGFRVVRVTDHTAICKLYDWAFTEERAKELVSDYEQSYKEHFSYPGGEIVTSLKNLGPELHNEPVGF